jgi:cell division protein FtsA
LDVGTSKIVAIVGEVNEDGAVDVIGLGTLPVLPAPTLPV